MAIAIRLELEDADVAQEQLAAQADQSVEFGDVENVALAPDGLEEARFVGTVAIVATVTVAWLIKRFADDWLKDRERGVQIDTRTLPATISRIRGVPRGYVVFIDPDGKAKAHKVDYDKAEDLGPLLQAALGAVA